MADMRRFGLADILLLVLVLALAAGARAGYLAQFAEGGKQEGPLRVQETPPEGERSALIQHVREDFWFAAKAPFSRGEETTAHVAPGYPYLVGLLAQQVPEEQLGSLVRWIQVGLGSLTAALYFLFARRAFRSLAVGLVAGLFTALHPFWIVAVATLDDSTLAGFALAGCLFLASQAGEKGGPLKSFLLGLGLAGLSLVRAAYLPFAFILLVWFLLRSRTLRLGWLCALCAFLGFGTALAPWTVRNYQVFEEPVPIVSSVYYHLWVGNSAHATGGPVNDEILESAPRDELEKIPRQPARYARLGREVFQEIRSQPVASCQRRLKAALGFFLGHKWLQDGTIAETNSSDMPDWLLSNYEVILNSALVSMVFLTFLGWRWSYGWRYESIPAALAVILVPLPYVLSHSGALSGDRLPLDGVLLCFSAFALCCFVPGLGGYLLAGAKEAPPPESQEQQQYL